MARRKCYFCEERFPEMRTRLARFNVGGDYQTGSGRRDVRCCYRCVAAQTYKTTFQNCSTPDKVEGMAKRGWTLPTDWEAHSWGWGVFDLLWPVNAPAPTDPAMIPERLRPPPEAL